MPSAIVLLLISTATQLVAAVYAAEAAIRTRRHLPWAALSTALLLMTARRSVTISRWLTLSDTQVDAVAESIALAISILMLVGVIGLVQGLRRDDRDRSGLVKREHHYRDLFREAVLDVTQHQRIGEQLEGLVAERTELLVETNAELQLANQRLQELADLKKQFFAFTTHELRSPLNAIIGFSGLLLRELPGPLNAEQRSQLTMLNDSSRHMLAVVNDLLQLESLEADAVSLDVVRFDLAELLRSVVDGMRPQFEGTNTRLELVIDKECAVSLAADQTRVRQVILNLLSNAVKYASGTSVVVSATCDEQQATITVADTGPGIAADHLAVIFEPFARLGSVADQAAGVESTGLGLAVTKRMVLALGGHVEVESDVGKGAKFVVHLPNAEAATWASAPIGA